MEQEERNHLFFECNVARLLWLKVAKLVDKSIPTFREVTDFFIWIDGIPAARFQRMIMESICASLIWVLWMFRNNLVFGNNKKYKKEFMFDSVISFSYNWYCNRNRKARKNWNEWMLNPLMN